MDKPNIEYAEGRVISFEDESAIQPSFLEIFTYTGPRQHVSYQMNEFAVVYPFSGLPDIQGLYGLNIFLDRNWWNSRH